MNKPEVAVQIRDYDSGVWSHPIVAVVPRSLSKEDWQCCDKCQKPLPLTEGCCMDVTCMPHTFHFGQCPHCQLQAAEADAEHSTPPQYVEALIAAAAAYQEWWEAPDTFEDCDHDQRAHEPFYPVTEPIKVNAEVCLYKLVQIDDYAFLAGGQVMVEWVDEEYRLRFFDKKGEEVSPEHIDVAYKVDDGEPRRIRENTFDYAKERTIQFFRHFNCDTRMWP